MQTIDECNNIVRHITEYVQMNGLCVSPLFCNKVSKYIDEYKANPYPQFRDAFVLFTNEIMLEIKDSIANFHGCKWIQLKSSDANIPMSILSDLNQVAYCANPDARSKIVERIRHKIFIHNMVNDFQSNLSDL